MGVLQRKGKSLGQYRAEQLYALKAYNHSDVPTARSTDPSTSHDAGEAHEASGQKIAEQRVVFGALVYHGASGVTSDELAHVSGLDRYMVARRLPELRDQRRLVEVRGYPEQPEKRRSEVSGRKGMVWRPVPLEPVQTTLEL